MIYSEFCFKLNRYLKNRLNAYHLIKDLNITLTNPVVQRFDARVQNRRYTLLKSVILTQNLLGMLRNIPIIIMLSLMMSLDSKWASPISHYLFHSLDI
ncbi:unnamed protein product, partial [Schistosoma haematobium]